MDVLYNHSYMRKVHLVKGLVVYVYWIDTVFVQYNPATEEALAIRRIFSQVDMITKAKIFK